MLNSWDIQFMEKNVQDIISGWQCSAMIYRAKPENEQPNFNTIMREYTGDVVYDIITVPCERKDIANTNNTRPDVVHSGVRDNGEIMYALPEYYNEHAEDGTTVRKRLDVLNDDIFEFSDLSPNHEKWRVKYVRNRIGEYVIAVELITGGTMSGTEALEV